VSAAGYRRKNLYCNPNGAETGELNALVDALAGALIFPKDGAM
jgi:hypothetical protein